MSVDKKSKAYYEALMSGYIDARARQGKEMRRQRWDGNYPVVDFFLSTYPRDTDDFLQYVKLLSVARKDIYEWKKVVNNAVAISEQMELDYPDDKMLAMAKEKLGLYLEDIKNEELRESTEQRSALIVSVIACICVVAAIVWYLATHPKVLNFVLIMDTVKTFILGIFSL